MTEKIMNALNLFLLPTCPNKRYHLLEIVSLVEKMGGEAMAQGMKAALLGYACFFFAAYMIDDTAMFVM